jgi:hypothetical protein
LEQSLPTVGPRILANQPTQFGFSIFSMESAFSVLRNQLAEIFLRGNTQPVTFFSFRDHLSCKLAGSRTDIPPTRDDFTEAIGLEVRHDKDGKEEF